MVQEIVLSLAFFKCQRRGEEEKKIKAVASQ